VFNGDGIIASAAVLVVLLTLLPLAVGIGLIVYGLSRGQKARQLERTGERVQGVVVDNQMESRTQGRITFRPIVRFRTLAGVETTAVAEQPSFRSHVVGTSVPVVYDPADPSRASVLGRGSGASGLVVMGVIVIVIGLCGAVFFLSINALA